MAHLRAKWVKQMMSRGVKVEAVKGEEKSTKPKEDPPSVESLTLVDENQGDEDEDEDEGEEEYEGEGDGYEGDGYGGDGYEGDDYENEDEGEDDEGDGFDDELENGEEEITEHEVVLDVREPAFNWSWWFEGRGSTYPQGR
ncbi:hypothetical protein BBK36DRAFT_2847 [Trichoderma citrinoviride]|uniref:Uncharacterized protein n=1 Tax=Trichoderma citrinoviride TaxID=58853 RepID=A0A2T4BFA9_9HYPO|nr:hypothetical protein BBK36DRAFT_2847 [Trichoderma citrinoviride]PTB68022.1 hypothetical protein BBK36DRAFT_2847 [Trichoderma citrinoviride]